MTVKRSLVAILAFILLLAAGGCGEAMLPAVPEKTIESFEDNSIDRAFAKMLAERGELENSAAFAYRYALQWYEEYTSLARECGGEGSPVKDWRGFSFDWQLPQIAVGYAKNRVSASSARGELTEAARFYKLLAFDCLARLSEHGENACLRTDESELYSLLANATYDLYVPDVFDLDYIWGASGDKTWPLPVYAALPEAGIYLSDAPPFGAVLSVQGTQYLYPWPGGVNSPRAILPRLSLGDFDVDGEDELAVIIYVGSGTGISIEEMYIIELSRGMWCTSVTGETLKNLLFGRLSALWDPAADEVAVTLDGKTVYVDSSFVPKESKWGFSGLAVTEIVGFEATGDTLTAHVSIGVCGFDFATPFDYIDFYADIVYDGESHISLVNCRLGR